MREIVTRQNILFLVYGLLMLAVLRMCQPKPEPVFNVSKPKVLVRGIQKEKEVINNHTMQVMNLQGMVNEMNDLRGDLMAELELVKKSRDTFRIVTTQDSLIRVLLVQSDYKDSVITHQYAIIDSQGRIIASQDTLLKLSESDLRRVKRQRNWSFVVNGVLTGLLILK